jgi:fluoride ion exporter CrcB/FEX
MRRVHHFSAFTLEGVGLIKEQRWLPFFSFVVASVVVGLLATYAGMKLTR